MDVISQSVTQAVAGLLPLAVLAPLHIIQALVADALAHPAQVRGSHPATSGCAALGPSPCLALHGAPAGMLLDGGPRQQAGNMVPSAGISAPTSRMSWRRMPQLTQRPVCQAAMIANVLTAMQPLCSQPASAACPDLSLEPGPAAAAPSWLLAALKAHAGSLASSAQVAPCNSAPKDLEILACTAWLEGVLTCSR